MRADHPPPKRRPKGDYEVGYARPPEATRFQPGRSGNPKGRPKKNATLSGALEAALNTKQRVRVNGREKTMTQAEIIIAQAVKQAMEGKPQAIALLLKREPVALMKVLPASLAPGSVEAALASADGAEAFAEAALSPTDRDMMEWFLARDASENGDAGWDTAPTLPADGPADGDTWDEEDAA